MELFNSMLEDRFYDEKEYNRIRSESEERVKKFQDKIIDLNKKIDLLIDSNGSHYDIEKYKFILSYNEALLKKAEELNDEDNRIREANKKAWQLHHLTEMTEFVRELEFSSPEQDELFDWKHNINFQETPIYESIRIANLKKTDKDSYLRELQKYIEDYKICEKILSTTSDNFYLSERLPVFEIAIDCFKNENYLPFICLAVPQIEGMFTDYMNIIGVNSSGNSITTKLERLNNQDRLWGYIYYAFDFPNIRNNVAHGYIIKSNLEEIASDILLDLVYIVKMIDSRDLEYKKAIDFLEDIAKEDDDKEKSKKVLDRFDLYGNMTMFDDKTYAETDEDIYTEIEDEIKSEENFFNKLFENCFSDVLEWYNLKSVLDDLKRILETEVFREVLIKSKMPIELKKRIVCCLHNNRISFPAEWKKDLFKMK
jgi:hypothetical protein